MRIFDSLDVFTATVGQKLGTSPWLSGTQEQVDLFADATGDHQWVHVDPEHAAAGPFGATIAHGDVTLWLVPSPDGRQLRRREAALSASDPRRFEGSGNRDADGGTPGRTDPHHVRRGDRGDREAGLCRRGRLRHDRGLREGPR